MLFVSGIYAWQWLGAFLAYGYVAVSDRSIPEALAISLTIYLVTTPAVLALSILIKWVFLGRIRPGRHPLWGFYYFRFWFVRAVTRVKDARIVLEKIIPVALKKAKPGTPEFRAALKEAMETMGRTVFSHGVMNWTAADHWGYTNETGVMLKVSGGQFVVEK